MGSSYSSVTPKKEDKPERSKHKAKKPSTKPTSETNLSTPSQGIWVVKWAKGQFERVFRKEKKTEELVTYKLKQQRKESFGSFIDLGPMSMIKYVQDHQWREVFLAGPTLNAAGNSGNDFPGFYYYDPQSKYEWVVIVKGNLNWQVTKCVRQCKRGRLQVGIISDRPFSKSVSIEVWHQACSVPPTQWDALKTLLDVSFHVLPLPTADAEEPAWVDIAYRTLVALKSRPIQVKVGGITGYGAIVEDLKEARLELLPNISLAYSLLKASSIAKLKAGNTIADRLIADVVPVFYNKNLKVFTNNLDSSSSKPSAETHESGDEILETWYLLSNLEKVIGILGLTEDKILKGYAFECLMRIIKLVQGLDYILPLFLDVKTGNEYGQLLNPSVLGIYAIACANALNIFPEERQILLKEAVQSLRVLHRFRIHQMHHEPFQLAYAAAAANIVGKLVEDSSITQWCFDFARATLLNMYRSDEYAGLFQACAGLNYPAFKESVETLDALSFLAEDKTLPFQDILSLALRNNLQFFKRNGDINELPYEGLPTNELSDAHNAGTAIYAAGYAFDLARLQLNAKARN